jgi:hypothetical protein
MPLNVNWSERKIVVKNWDVRFAICSDMSGIKLKTLCGKSRFVMQGINVYLRKLKVLSSAGRQSSFVDESRGCPSDSRAARAHRTARSTRQEWFERRARWRQSRGGGFAERHTG